MSATLYCGDVRDVLARLPEGSVQTCVTSPPYWGLRDYGHTGQLGLERTPEEYVGNMVAVFRAVRRVLRDDGTLWLNLGDSYAGAKVGNTNGGSSSGLKRNRPNSRDACNQRMQDEMAEMSFAKPLPPGLKPKDLVGIPWRVAFALQAGGWYLRSDIIWAKPNPMPESVTDRPTKAHEYLFLLTKAERYYYDAAAIAEPHTSLDRPPGNKQEAVKGRLSPSFVRPSPERAFPEHGRNARTVWTIATQPYSGAHFATFPEDLARRCILAGSRPDDTVLDPFGGSGTTAAVAVGHGRKAIHVDLNPAYLALARERIGPMLCQEATDAA